VRCDGVVVCVHLFGVFLCAFVRLTYMKGDNVWVDG